IVGDYWLAQCWPLIDQTPSILVEEIDQAAKQIKVQLEEGRKQTVKHQVINTNYDFTHALSQWFAISTRLYRQSLPVHKRNPFPFSKPAINRGRNDARMSVDDRKNDRILVPYV
uniref:Uncharacterized protein n=1 Tax=Romanomermis culicivorax TaxID=13658 RepID=A0A915ICL8_ROMCU